MEEGIGGRIEQDMERKRKWDGEEDERFSKKSWVEDLALLVEGKRLYVSKVVLSLESPVFSAMFESDSIEKSKNEIELRDKNHAEFVEFLQCLYPGVRKPVTFENVFTVLPLAKEYQVDSVMSECEKCLLLELNNLERSAIFYCRAQGVSSLYDLPEVEKLCIAHLSKETQKVIQNAEKFYPLPLDSKNRLLTEINKNLRAKIKVLKNSLLAKDNEVIARNKTISALKEKEETLNRFRDFFSRETDHLIEGVITLVINNVKALTSNGKTAMKMFRGYKWYLSAYKTAVAEKEYFSIYAHIVHVAGKHIECNAWIKFTLKGMHRDKVSVMGEQIFTSNSPTLGYPTWIEWDKFISAESGYVPGNKAKIEMSMMVHYPFIERKAK